MEMENNQHFMISGFQSNVWVNKSNLAIKLKNSNM